MSDVRESLSYVCASGIARSISVSIMFPFDSIKSRLQNNTQTHVSVYAGYRYTICTQAVYGMLVFGTYENLKRRWLEKYEGGGLYIYFASAVISDMLGSIFLSPCEIIKQNIQIGRYRDVRHAIENIGWRGLYRGYGALVVRDLPFRAIQLPLYDRLKEYSDNPQLNGCVAGMTAAAITNPLDVVKTKVMCGNGMSGVADSIKWQNLFAGLPYRVAYLGGMSSIYFLMYESIRERLFSTKV
jgi:solute carrier family 25 S-adenosylmethionine transporter 26